MRYLLVAIFCLLTFTAHSQKKKVSSGEAARFYSKVKETKEYKSLLHTLDSSNADKNNPPQEYEFWIAYDRQPDSANGKFLYGIMTRKLSIGIVLEQYQVTYDRKSKKITEVRPGMSLAPTR